MRLILASASPRRRELLGALVDDFEVVPSDLPETFGGDAAADAVRLAAAKAQEVAACHEGAIVVGADTIVFDASRLYGKPTDAAEAREMLAALEGGAHRVVTGVAVATAAGVEAGATVAGVTLASLSPQEIDAYVASGVPLDKAGAYAIQHEEFAVVAALDGCYCAVVGLPLWRLRAMLSNAGVETRPPDETFDRCAMCPDRPPAGQEAPAPAGP